MAERRWYDDACGTAMALERVGERWSLLIMRELMFGPRRFGDLRAGLNGISANVLTQRLEGLEGAQLLLRRRLPPPASVPVYELTPWGYESEAAICALGRWAARSPDHDPLRPLSNAAIMLALRALFDRARAGAMRATIGFRFEDDGFVAEVAAGAIAIRRAETKGVEVVFAGDTAMLGAVVFGGLPLADAEAAGNLTVTGDRALAARFVALFPLPAKAGASQAGPMASRRRSGSIRTA